MPNLYATLTDIKSAGMLNNATTSAYDSDLLDALEEGSRQIEKDCDRFFYIYEGTFYQDGGANRVILDWDVQSVTTLKIDTDGDGTYETTFNLTSTPVDAFLYPLNISPKTRMEANPYGTIGHFAAGVRNGIQIVGTFGYGNDWPAAYTHSNANTLTAALTSTSVTMTVYSSSDSIYQAGQTIQFTSSTAATEQVFISAATNSTTYTIQRAQNGTTAVAPGTTATIAIYDYPAAIRKAVLIYAMRIWKRRESAFQNQVGNPEFGTVTVWKATDPDWQNAVKNYHKNKRGWYLR